MMRRFGTAIATRNAAMRARPPDIHVQPASPPEPDPATRDFYVHALRLLDDAKIAHAVGGGYALAHYTGIQRNTKDLDIFIRPVDRDRTLSILASAGYKTEFFYPFWISKALHGDAFIDILYSSGNGICVVDDEWFSFAEPIDVHSYRSRAIPVEEQIWSKAFVQDRDRFDGADILHLLVCRAHAMNWKRLLRRFAGHERVLLAHLVLFDYAYPSQRHVVPRWVHHQINQTVAREVHADQPICRGTNLAVRGYGIDLRQWGFLDGRALPHGQLTAEEIDQLPEQ